MQQKHSGFTLSEVLITLTIIGVISAITIPALVQTTEKKELKTALKKQYSTLKQAILKIKMTDSLEFSYDIYASRFKKRLAQEYITLKDCGVINNNTGCVLLEDDNTFQYYKTFNGGTLNRYYFDDGGFIANDGTVFFIEQGSQARDYTGYVVSIDVNGYIKGPNRMGRDLFMFQITEEGEVLPMGAKNTYWYNNRAAYCSRNSSANTNGFTCAYYALTDKNYFRKF